MSGSSSVVSRRKPISVDRRGDRERESDQDCYCCARHVKPSKARYVVVVDGGDTALHPLDWPRYDPSDPGAVGEHVIGSKCARVLGLEWSRRDERDTGDAECTSCGRMYTSGDGPPLDVAICGECFRVPGPGPLGVAP